MEEMENQLAENAEQTEQVTEPQETASVETPVCKKQQNGALRFLYPVLIAFAVLFVFGYFFGRIVFYPIEVQGASMQPNLNANYFKKDGNNYNCDIVYLGSDRNVSRGDIVAFDSGVVVDGEHQNYIKRVIGVPGDTIQFQITKVEDHYIFYDLYVNGVKQNEDYVKEEMKIFEFSQNESEMKFIATYLVAQKKETLAENEFYMMGDNRNNSVDSRHIGVVNKSQFIGKVYLHIRSGETTIQAIFRKIF